MSETNNPNSNWSSYLKLFPDYEKLDLPMFWDDTTFESLSNTCVYRNVKADLVNMRKEFDTIIVPFIKEHQEFFDLKCLNFEFYKQIAAFIMAYSFRDPNEDVSHYITKYFNYSIVLNYLLCFSLRILNL